MMVPPAEATTAASNGAGSATCYLVPAPTPTAAVAVRSCYPTQLAPATKSSATYETEFPKQGDYPKKGPNG